MFSRINSLGVYGMDSFLVQVEADITPGMYKYNIVGLPDTAVSEARDRVRSAIRNSRKYFPNAHITINLAPADVKKEGPLYDLPILVALLVSSNQLEDTLQDSAFLGELSLNGEVRPVNGVLPMIIRAREAGIRAIYIPRDNAAEGAAIDGITVYPVDTVTSLLRHLSGEQPIQPVKPADYQVLTAESNLDFSDIRGQESAKRAMEIAAAGGHNVIMIGPPGSGKSMIAKRIPTILPDMTQEESIETTKIHSIAGDLPQGVSLIRTRPFRAPHHTTSAISLSGGGVTPRPGEVSLAHNGVLFLDELPEFSRPALEILRQPMEDGRISISRVSGTVTYPCSVMVVGAMNPCPCGYLGHPTRNCSCSERAAAKYINRLSGPLLDRIDIQIEVPPVEYETISSDRKGESSADIRKRVNAARQIQQQRLKNTAAGCNAHMDEGQIHQYCVITPTARTLMKKVFEVLGLSARGHDKILKIARTIADLDGSEIIDDKHISEAIHYRSLDRKYWNRSGI